MSLYQTGTVNMTNNSAAVVGVGTAFVANVTAGDGFLISGETVYYTVLSITDDTHLTLSVVYAGATGTGKSYQVSRDWTINLGLAEVQPGDPSWPYLLTQQVIRKIDTLLAPKESPIFTTQITTPKIVTASGNLIILPATNANTLFPENGTGYIGIRQSTPLAYVHIGPTSGFTPQIMMGQATAYRLDIGYNNGGEYGFLQAYAANTSTYDDIVINPLGGNVGIRVTSPTAAVHLPAGTATANTGPLKFTAGTNLTTPESGAMEFDGTNLYITIAGVRKTIQVV